MPSAKVDRFVKSLQKLEESGDSKEIVELFSDDCEICNVAIKPLHGKQGARQFWRDYAATFQEVHTQFEDMSEEEGKAFLEWTSRGVLQSGRPLVYEGLTRLDWQGDKIKSMKAYHDSAVFLKEGGKHIESSSDSHSAHKPISTHEVMKGGPRRDISTPNEGVLTSTLKDRDTATD